MKAAARRSPGLRPLPRGWHPLTREAVSASQRGRLVDAMVQAVAERGYAEITVANVVALAGVSRRTFYELFSDKEACFLAAYEAGLEFLLEQIRRSLEALPESDWRARARASLEAYLAGLAAKPAAAWVFSIEVFAAGAKALDRREAVISRWIAQWRSLNRIARGPSRDAVETSDERLRALVGGIEELVRHCLRTRGADRLPDLAGPATALAISVLESLDRPADRVRRRA